MRQLAKCECMRWPNCLRPDNWKHLIIQQDLIEQITITNKVYNRICDRNDKVDKEAIKDLLKQNPKKCYYCGIDKETINILNYAAKTNNSLDRKSVV